MGNKLKLQYFGHLTQRADSLKRPRSWERLKAGGEGDKKMRWLDGITDSMDMSFSKLQKMKKDKEAWHVAIHGDVKSQARLSN